MKNTIKFLTLFLIFTLATTDFLFAQKNNSPPNPNIALCNNINGGITRTAIRRIIEDSCYSILSDSGKIANIKIIEFTFYYRKKLKKINKEKVKGENINSKIIEWLRQANPGDFIAIDKIIIETKNRKLKQNGRMYSIW